MALEPAKVRSKPGSNAVATMNQNNDGLDQPDATFALESGDRLDRALVNWSALRGGVWSGTATELILAVKAEVHVADDTWPGSASVLLAHIESHQQELHSMGVEFLLTRTCPRMITIRSSPHERRGQKPPTTSEIKISSSEEPHTIPSDPEGSVSDSTAETLIAMLRTSTPPESSGPRIISKLADVPAHLRSVFKKAWMRPPRAM
jgi:hypothetical protein